MTLHPDPIVGEAAARKLEPMARVEPQRLPMRENPRYPDPWRTAGLAPDVLLVFDADQRLFALVECVSSSDRDAVRMAVEASGDRARHMEQAIAF